MNDRRLDRPIVVIEDSDEDFEVTVWAFRQAGVTNPVHRCATAATVADLFIHHVGGPGAPSPSFPLLVLLDLNIPGADWQDTLTQLRSHPRWRVVPVIILSTSSQPATVSACYHLGAAGYLQKPLDLEGFAASVSRLVAYWLATVVLPEGPEPSLR